MIRKKRANSEFEVMDINQATKELLEQEQQTRENLQNKGINPDFMSNELWWEKLKIEEQKVDNGFFGNEKTKQKYANYLKQPTQAQSEEEKFLNLIEKPEDLKIYKKYKDFVNTDKVPHVLDDSDNDSEDMTEDLISNINEFKENLKQIGLDEKMIEDDIYYKFYKDREALKKEIDDQKIRTHEQRMNDALGLAKQLKMEEAQDVDLILQKFTMDDLETLYKKEHKQNVLLKKMGIEQSDELQMKELLETEMSVDKSRELWLKNKQGSNK